MIALVLRVPAPELLICQVLVVLGPTRVLLPEPPS